MTTTTPAETEIRGDLRQLGTVLIIAGVLGTIAGILALVFPDMTLLALALIAGINLLLLGALSLVDAFSDDGDTAGRVFAAVLGLLGIIAGLVVMRRPGESLLAVLLVLGIWLVVTGIVDLVRAVANAAGPRAPAPRPRRRPRARRADPRAARRQPQDAGAADRDRVHRPRRAVSVVRGIALRRAVPA